MDPYLEAHWLDVNTSLIGDARNVLNQFLPDDLAASSEERVAVESESDDPAKPFYPDVRLFELPNDSVAVADPRSATSSAAPVRLLAQVEQATERFIRIIDIGTERLITVIEFLSTSTKHNPGMAEFKSKRAELLTAGVNFVEVDLVREGNWQALLRPHQCPAKWATTYRATVRMPSDPGAVGLYPISLREPLPSIVIPLRQHDPEVKLDLQALVNQAYTNGRYGRRLDYTQLVEPPLDAGDQEWASKMK